MMRTPGRDLAPILWLLAVFFAGSAFAVHHSLSTAAETTPVLSHANNLLVEAQSCPCHVFHTTRNTTILELQPHVPSNIIREPELAHGAQSDRAPFTSLPIQLSAKLAEHCPTIQLPVPELRRAPSPSIRSRINAARLSVLEIVPQTKSLRASLPAGRRDLSALAASALKLGSSSPYVAAAMLALLLLGTIMCTL